MLTRHSQRALVACALTAALACGAVPVDAIAAPSSGDVASQQAAVDRAVRDYEAARARANEVESSVAASSAKLDGLVAEQQRAQQRLSAHVASTYRYGPVAFLEVIMSASNFEQFATRWFLLTRINEQDAVSVAEVKIARQRAVAAAKRLIAQQESASRELRSLQQAAAKARAELAGSRAAYAAYRRRIAASASPAASPSAPRAPSPVSSILTGSGMWSSAKASHYGSGSWGHRTADGTTVRADSMIVAHKTLPFGTLVEFEYNGKRAVARVADRGPYVSGRTWDLGPGVIAVLGFNGVHTVRYRIIGR